MIDNFLFLTVQLENPTEEKVSFLKQHGAEPISGHKNKYTLPSNKDTWEALSVFIYRWVEEMKFGTEAGTELIKASNERLADAGYTPKEGTAYCYKGEEKLSRRKILSELSKG